VKGIEPSTSGATTRHSNHLSYTHHSYLARLQGFEPGTYGLEVRCSIQLSYRRILIVRPIRRRLMVITPLNNFVKINAERLTKSCHSRVGGNPGVVAVETAKSCFVIKSPYPLFQRGKY
jgi:hypothetical protein